MQEKKTIMFLSISYASGIQYTILFNHDPHFTGEEV